MSQLKFTVLSKGTASAKVHVLIYVGTEGQEVEYCLVTVLVAHEGRAEIQDVKQARFDDVKNYLLDILRKDETTSTLACALPPEELTLERFGRIFGALASHSLGLPKGAPIDNLERLHRYTAADQGSTAWGEILDQVEVDREVQPELAEDGDEEVADLDSLVGRADSPRPEAQRPQAPLPVPDEDEGAFDALLGEETPTPATAKLDVTGAAPAPSAPAMPKREKLSGVEGKLVYFTARYSKILSGFSALAHSAGQNLEHLKPAAAQAAEQIRQLLKDVTPVPPEFYGSKSLAKASPDFNSLYIRELYLNLPELKQKSKSEIVRLLSMELTPSSKREPESIAVQLLYKNRFDLPPDMGEKLRDLLRFSFGKPVALEESFPFVARKVDLTKLYYCYRRPGEPVAVTDVFCFRELDGRCGMVYVPYQYLGTGVINDLARDFFAHPWNPPSSG